MIFAPKNVPQNPKYTIKNLSQRKFVLTKIKIKSYCSIVIVKCVLVTVKYILATKWGFIKQHQATAVKSHDRRTKKHSAEFSCTFSNNQNGPFTF